jgi:heme exporter protein B
VLPLYIPVLIFGSGAVEATVSGLGGAGHIFMLGAIFLLSLVLSPLATVAALRVSAE